jgi:hypothetical protein
LTDIVHFDRQFLFPVKTFAADVDLSAVFAAWRRLYRDLQWGQPKSAPGDLIPHLRDRGVRAPDEEHRGERKQGEAGSSALHLTSSSKGAE